jgi:aminoglycoside phosphotransferase (APT) family kinase protein
VRQGWERDSAEIALDRAAIAELLAPAFPRAAIAGFERVSGGLVNTNLKIMLRDRSAPVLLRIYQRDAEQGLKEAALIRILGPRVPVPELLYAVDSNPVTGHAYAILSWVDGRRLDTLVAAGEDLHSAGQALGAALANVHAAKFDRFGFLGADLNIVHPIDLDRAGLLAYLEHSFAAGPGASRLGPELLLALRSFLEREGGRISSWPGVPCLVHGDCNGSNLLFGQSRIGGWELAAILDWEFAFSGTPGFDFAHLLRPPFAPQIAFVEAVATSYRVAGGALPPDWRTVARITDLFAWIDIASRQDVGPKVIADAQECIRAIIGGSATGQP